MIQFEFFGVVLFSLLFVFDIFHYFKGKKTILHLFYKLMLYIYLFMLINITLFSIPVQSRLLQDLRAEGYDFDYNIIPFRSILDIINNNTTSNILRQIGGNFILLIPLGVYVPLMYKKFHDLKLYFGMMVLVSIIIEFTQWTIGEFIQYHYRVVDIDDILLNVIGSTLGYIGYLLISRILPSLVPKLTHSEDSEDL